MLEMFLVLVGVCSLFLAIRLLHLASQAAPPSLHCQFTEFNSAVIRACPLLQECYVPPLLWGKSGHIQTMIYGKMGRVKNPFPKGERLRLLMRDGATMTYDLFEPHVPHPSGEDYTIVMCPGLANSSESLYICTCVDHAQNAGYRVAVLNHMGALKSEKLTAPRIFTYGGTEEFGMMVDHVLDMYPTSKLIASGFSMGGNIVIKYLGECEDNQAKITAAMSFCQGYSVADAVPYLLSWEQMRRVYLWAMTKHQMSLIKNHRDILLEPSVVEKHEMDPSSILASNTLLEMDERYSRRRAGHESVTEYYEQSSCKNVAHNITIPTLIVNTMDDPIVPVTLHKYPHKLAKTNANVIFATVEHGGHLGFFEGGMMVPDTVTWLDRMVVQYADAVSMSSVPLSRVHEKVESKTM